MDIKTGDTVKILIGKDRNKTGKVTVALPRKNMIVVDGVNIVTRHMKPRKQGDAGGIVKSEGAFYASKAQVVCSKCGEATRVGHRQLTDGTKVRYCKKCNEDL